MIYLPALRVAPSVEIVFDADAKLDADDQPYHDVYCTLRHIDNEFPSFAIVLRHRDDCDFRAFALAKFLMHDFSAIESDAYYAAMNHLHAAMP